MDFEGSRTQLSLVRFFYTLERLGRIGRKNCWNGMEGTVDREERWNGEGRGFEKSRGNELGSFTGGASIAHA